MSLKITVFMISSLVPVGLTKLFERKTKLEMWVNTKIKLILQDGKPIFTHYLTFGYLNTNNSDWAVWGCFVTFSELPKWILDWSCIFTDGVTMAMDLQYNLCSKLGDSSASVMRRWHLVSNTLNTTACTRRGRLLPSVKMRYQANSFVELASVTETHPPWPWLSNRCCIRLVKHLILLANPWFVQQIILV